MKEPNDLPKMISQEDAIKQAKADFHQLMKNYGNMKYTAQGDVYRESLLTSETYSTQTNALNNVR